jgi:hypothetical protein
MHADSAAHVKPGHAASAARPWKTDGYTDRSGGRIPSAIRPWILGYSGTRRYKAARPGTETKRPASREFQLAGRFRRWWQVLGSNHRRLSLAANLAQAQPDAWGRIVAAVPPAAFLVAVSMVERRAARRPRPDADQDDSAGEPSAPGRPSPLYVLDPLGECVLALA